MLKIGFRYARLPKITINPGHFGASQCPSAQVLAPAVPRVPAVNVVLQCRGGANKRYFAGFCWRRIIILDIGSQAERPFIRI